MHLYLFNILIYVFDYNMHLNKVLLYECFLDQCLPLQND